MGCLRRIVLCLMKDLREYRRARGYGIPLLIVAKTPYTIFTVIAVEREQRIAPAQPPCHPPLHPAKAQTINGNAQPCALRSAHTRVAMIC